jgi:murein DD-endopeptidase MepM/ murein hydrolase activator NlpD
MITGEGAKNEEFAGWGRNVIAPASGLVTYSRNDVPDNLGPGVIDMDALQRLPEQPWPTAGNVVVIDHGGGEYSLLGHMQKGSVRVKRGDRVVQADVLGRLGNSGHSQGPHLHYHLMNGELLFRSDGLPSHFENVEGGTPTQGVMSEAK